MIRIFVWVAEAFLIFILLAKAGKYFKELIQNLPLLIGLALNDLKFKYAGALFGMVWAFVQPVLTTLVYWFVFQLGFKSQPVDNFPFILWLVAGLTPWFYFGETVISGTGSLQEYSYLVKKVMFNVDIIPAVKVVSGFLVQLVFIGFVAILYVFYGVGVSIYIWQVLYYAVAMLFLTLGLVYLFSALNVFLKDIIQLVSVITQLVFWSVPIVWDINAMPEGIQTILMLNPLYYIVEGYRDAFINRVWFWEKLSLTLNFWLIVAAIFLLGTTLFHKLKPHFADVL